MVYRNEGSVEKKKSHMGGGEKNKELRTPSRDQTQKKKEGGGSTAGRTGGGSKRTFGQSRGFKRKETRLEGQIHQY